MTYDEKNIPDFALQPAKEPEEIEDDGFDPSPYDRILGGGHYYGKMRPTKEPRANLEREFSMEDFGAETEMLPGEDLFDERVEINMEEIPTEQVPDVYAKEEDEGDIIEAVEATEEFVSETAETEDIAEAVGPAEAVSEELMEAAVVEEEAAIEPAMEVEQPAVVLPKKEPAKIIPLAGAVTYSELKLTDIREKPQTRIFIEEDILVPDVKPDMAEILSMDGTVKLSDRELKASQNGDDFIKVSGEIALQTIYIPDGPAGAEPISTISSRLPFKTDWTIGVSPLSHLVIRPVIETVDFTVINERKFRAKVTLALTMREYASLDVQLFEGIRGEEVQMLKETILLTDVAARKSDTIDINETLPLKDGMAAPEKILKQDIHIVENHKQITGEKAVINATVYCNVLYLAKGEKVHEESGGADMEQSLVEEMEERTYFYPCFYQGKTEFTQFIPVDGSEVSFGSRVTFDGSSLSIGIRERADEEEHGEGFALEGSVLTALEIYRNLESEIVTDVYHNVKDIDYDYSEIGTMALAGSGVTEISVREILNVPSRYGDVEKVTYVSGRIKESRSAIEQGKNIVEGVVEVSLICIAADEAKTPFKMTQDLNFRGAMEIPGIKSTMVSVNDISIRELWFDKINNKQVEVNAGIFISSAVSSQDTHRLIKNVCFVERGDEQEVMPCMVIYITKSGDNLWKIAKKYRTTIDSIRKINSIEQNAHLAPGTKLLIVK